VMHPIEVGTVVKLKGVLFKQSTAIMLPESYPELDAVAEFLTTNPKVRIEIAGHTDNRGSPQSNLKLSNDRAAEVKKYLIGKGIDGGRMTGKGYGGTKPITKNDSEASRRLNRRVEFIIKEK
jgi:OOP family OmpA-OmpF porin